MNLILFTLQLSMALCYLQAKAENFTDRDHSHSTEVSLFNVLARAPDSDQTDQLMRCPMALWSVSLIYTQLLIEGQANCSDLSKLSELKHLGMEKIFLGGRGDWLIMFVCYTGTRLCYFMALASSLSTAVRGVLS